MAFTPSTSTPYPPPTPTTASTWQDLDFASLVTRYHEPSEVPMYIVVEDKDKDKPAKGGALTAAEPATATRPELGHCHV
jgi:hypothetical protein